MVEVGFYETQEWWLISPEGRRLTPYGKPYTSPDQQSIATICAGLEYSGGQPNALQLFRMQQGTLRKVWELRPEQWEPEEVFWVDAATLFLKREAWGAGGQTSISYWKLTLAPAS